MAVRLGDLLDSATMTLLGPDLALPLTVKADSRQLRPGEGFLAVQGTRADGHRFIDDALEAGASLIVAEAQRVPPETVERWPDRTFLLTQGDSSHGLAALASARLRTLPDLREVVAITGSVGKTTAKSHLYQLLQGKYHCSCAQGNYNTLIGCGFAVLAAEEDCQILILEMGANHQGEIAEMVSYYQPTLAGITETALAHVEGFGSLEGIIAAKCEILSSPRLRAAAVNGDNPGLMATAQARIGQRALAFGTQGAVSFRHGRSVWQRDHFQVSAVITGLDGISFTPSLALTGLHQLYPLCCALALAGLCGLSTKEATAEIHRCRSLAGRGSVVVAASGASILDESYNASPPAMAATLKALQDASLPGRLFLVLGEMLELGSSSQEAHRRIFAQASSMDAQIFLFGSGWNDVAGTESLLFQSHQELIDAIEAQQPRRGDLILVKGSQGNRLAQVVKDLEL